ncbi:MAG: BatA and WFA domain-containing protein, partial [Melioribacteraceae bacterium]|nr:BatA and WFA domain-containing protein [Melioribacteraceae bacterium]
MVFLNPSILLGLLAASIPILIHLLNFRKLQKVEFSTLSFLKELQKSKIKKIKIKQWLLLLLRVLIITFLVLAFARPTLENVSIAGSTSTAKSSSVFIIDNSFSMNHIGDEGSNFNRSKKKAKEIISQMEDGDQFCFVLTNDSIITTTKIEQSLKIIDNLETDFLSEETFSKIERAISFLNESQNINKEIFLFSDFQKSTFVKENSVDSISSVITQKDIKFYSFDMSLENSKNISINNLQLRNSIIEINKPLTFSATINNHSKENINNITASLFLNNKRVAQQNVNLNQWEKKNIELETSLSSTGLIEVRIELEEDNIVEDNIFYLNFWVPKKIETLLLYENLSDLVFIESAINSYSKSNQIEITKLKISNSANENLEKYNVIFLISGEVGNAHNLSDYLNNGGSLVFIPSNDITISKLSNIKRAIDLPSFKNIVFSSTNSDYLEFSTINFNHPIFISLFEKNKKTEIESPAIFKYIKFDPSSKINSIINLIDGSIFLGEYNIGAGRVLFMNTSPILEWSNLPLKGIFAPLISRMVLYLSSKQNNNNSYLPGEVINLAVNQLAFPLIDAELPTGNDKINLQNNKRN